MSEHTVSLTVNGTDAELTLESRTLLVHALRDELGYTGPKVGCESGTCGACTVRVDGDAVKSCTVLAVQADGADVRTVEGLADEAAGADSDAATGEASEGTDAAGTRDTLRGTDDAETLHPIQRAFHEEHGLQCGYCTPGMVLSTAAFLEENPSPSEAEIRTALKGNVCRCTGYGNVVSAVETAADALEAERSSAPSAGRAENEAEDDVESARRIERDGGDGERDVDRGGD